jgi:signal peptide peptidase SppA
MTRGAHVLSFAVDHPWAITRPMGPIVAGILARWAAGKDSDPATIAAALVNRKNLPQPPGDGAVAIIPMYGVIAPRANLITDFSGGTTFEGLSKALAEAMANKAIKTVVFDADTPGGNAAGATEFAREVMRARTKKPIIAVAQYMMASAAYWGLSGATEIVAAPSAKLGSIGVFTIHEDLSKALEMEGVKLTYIAAGKYKVDGNETEPLGKDTLARIQAKVDEAYEKFLSDVSKGRGVALDEIRAGFGEGDTVSAAEALRLGMIDRIATLDETIARVMTPPDQRASVVVPDLKATTTDTKDTTPTVDTSQEPAKATDQDRPSDANWQNGINAGLLQLDM